MQLRRVQRSSLAIIARARRGEPGDEANILAREVDTILRKGGHNFTMNQRCSSRDRARCDVYVRNSQGGSQSHAAVQEGELH